jgi:hypothetical protein
MPDRTHTQKPRILSLYARLHRGDQTQRLCLIVKLHVLLYTLVSTVPEALCVCVYQLSVSVVPASSLTFSSFL